MDFPKFNGTNARTWHEVHRVFQFYIREWVGITAFRSFKNQFPLKYWGKCNGEQTFVAIVYLRGGKK